MNSRWNTVTSLAVAAGVAVTAGRASAKPPTPAEDLAPVAVLAQVAQPGAAAEGEARAARTPHAAAEPSSAWSPGIHARSYELPAIEVQGEAPRELREEERIGPNEQPRWTAQRRFLETRVYVIPTGVVDFEYWWVAEIPKDSSEPTPITTQYEFEMGLPYRTQLDIYLVGNREGNDGPFAIDEQKVELRWALAKWGRIWGNPTYYLEWVGISNAPDHVEMKGLFGGELTSGVHWGANYVWEHELGGPQENSNELTFGLSKTLKDEKFSAGAEVKLAIVDTRFDRSENEKEFLLGPSLQWRPLPQAHIDIVGLWGTTDESPKFKSLLVAGWEF